MTNYESILKYAMEMELHGARFFEKHAKEFKNPVTKKIFEELTEIEYEHYEFLKEQLEYYMINGSFNMIDEQIRLRNEKENDIFRQRSEVEKLEKSLEESEVPDLTVLRTAYLIEKDFAEFYRKAMESAETEEARKVFEVLAKWEDGHEALFKKEYDKKMSEYMNLPWGG